MAGVEQRHDLAVDRQQFTLVGDALADDAGKGRAYLGIGEDLAATSSWASDTATIEVLFSAVERAWSAADCDDVAGGKGLLVRTVARRPAQLGPRRIDRRLPLVDLRLELGGFEAREQLALRDLVAFADQDLGEASRDARLDDGLVDRLGRAGESHDVDKPARLDRVDFLRNQLERPGDAPPVRESDLGRGGAGRLPGESPAGEHRGNADDCDEKSLPGCHDRRPLRIRSR